MDFIFKNEMEKNNFKQSVLWLIAAIAYAFVTYFWFTRNINFAILKEQQKMPAELSQLSQFILILCVIMTILPTIIFTALSMIEIIPINKISKWFCPKSRVLCYLYSKYGDECKLLEFKSTHLKIGTANDYVIVPMQLVTFGFDPHPQIDKITLCVNRKYIKLFLPISGYFTKDHAGDNGIFLGSSTKNPTDNIFLKK